MKKREPLRDLIFDFHPFILLALVILLLVIMSGCGQVRYVSTASEHVKLKRDVEHDTVEVVRVVSDRVVERVKDSTHVVVDEQGNEKSRDRVQDRYLFIENRDSVNFYRAKVDSLMSMKVDSVEVPVPVERELSRWERVKMKIGGLCVEGFGIVCLTAAVVWLIRRKEKRKGGV